MKRFLSVLLSNLVVTGSAYWGLIYENHAATVVAVSLLWFTAIASILVGLICGDKELSENYKYTGFFILSVASLFDVFNAFLAVKSDRPILAIFILAGSAFYGYYVSNMDKNLLAK